MIRPGKPGFIGRPPGEASACQLRMIHELFDRAFWSAESLRYRE